MKINVILYQPEIPNNTGNIIRTCFATGAKLHIIKPISFDLSPKWLKRSGAGKVLEDIEYEIHESYENFHQKHGLKNIFYITRYGFQYHSDPDYQKEIEKNKEIFLMFGRESTGIPKKILRAHQNYCLRIPMTKASRSLNLANTVMLLVYEVLRQNNYQNLSKFEVQKGKNWILED